MNLKGSPSSVSMCCVGPNPTLSSTSWAALRVALISARRPRCQAVCRPRRSAPPSRRSLLARVSEDSIPRASGLGPSGTPQPLSCAETPTASCPSVNCAVNELPSLATSGAIPAARRLLYLGGRAGWNDAENHRSEGWVRCHVQRGHISPPACQDARRVQWDQMTTRRPIRNARPETVGPETVGPIRANHTRPHFESTWDIRLAEGSFRSLGLLPTSAKAVRWSALFITSHPDNRVSLRSPGATRTSSRTE